MEWHIGRARMFEAAHCPKSDMSDKECHRSTGAHQKSDGLGLIASLTVRTSHRQGLLGSWLLLHLHLLPFAPQLFPSLFTVRTVSDGGEGRKGEIERKTSIDRSDAAVDEHEADNCPTVDISDETYRLS